MIFNLLSMIRILRRSSRLDMASTRKLLTKRSSSKPPRRARMSCVSSTCLAISGYTFLRHFFKDDTISDARLWTSISRSWHSATSRLDSSKSTLKRFVFYLFNDFPIYFWFFQVQFLVTRLNIRVIPTIAIVKVRISVILLFDFLLFNQNQPI